MIDLGIVSKETMGVISIEPLADTPAPLPFEPGCMYVRD